MKTKAIREFEKDQGQGSVIDRILILTIFVMPSFAWRMVLFFFYIIILFLRDLKLKKARSENLLVEPIYYYSYFPFIKEDFLKAWFIDDIERLILIIIMAFSIRIFSIYKITSYKSVLEFMGLYLLFVGIFKPAKIYNIFYNSKKKSSLYKVYLITSSFFLVLGIIYTLAFIISFNFRQNILVEKIITRQSLMGVSIISYTIYILGNIIALVDWDKTYNEK